MPLNSLEAFLVTLAFVVPGAVGIGIRDSFWPKRPAQPFEQFLHAIGYSAGALFLLEILTGLIGLISTRPWRLGDYLATELATAHVGLLVDELAVWYKLLGLAAMAFALPSLVRYIRSSAPVLRLRTMRGISLHNDGFEALFEETLFEAAKWDPRWRFDDNESPWLMVDTQDGRRFRGQMMWRSAPPAEPELILIEVSDITDSEQVIDMSGMLLISGDRIERLWVMKPRPDPAPTLNAV